MDLENSSLAIPVISAIVERETNNRKEILLQTRVAQYDKLFYGSLEIPAGRIERFENIYDTIIREVREETGLEVIEIYPKRANAMSENNKNGKAIVFQPYCCQQMLKGNIPWIGFVFLCKVNNGTLKPAEDETKNLHWVSVQKLKEIVEKSPDKIFTLQLPVLQHYLKGLS